MVVSARKKCEADAGTTGRGGGQGGLAATRKASAGWPIRDLFVVAVLGTGNVEGYDDRFDRFIDKTRAHVGGTAGGLVQFGFAGCDEYQAVLDALDCFIRQRVPVAGTGIGILGDFREYAFHDTQYAFFLGELGVWHAGVPAGCCETRGRYCDTERRSRQGRLTRAGRSCTTVPRSVLPGCPAGPGPGPPLTGKFP